MAPAPHKSILILNSVELFWKLLSLRQSGLKWIKELQNKQKHTAVRSRGWRI